MDIAWTLQPWEAAHPSNTLFTGEGGGEIDVDYAIVLQSRFAYELFR